MEAQTPVGKLHDSYKAEAPSGSGASFSMTEKEIQIQQEAEVMAARADMKTFMAMVTANQNIIHKVARLYTNNRTDQKDLEQEISYQLWKAYPFYEKKSKASTWMYSVARKTASTAFRSQSRDVVEVRDVLPDLPVAPDYGVHDDEVIALLMKLTPTDRLIITLMFDGYTNREIAAILDLSEEALLMRVSRLKKNNQHFFQE
jgi:RNA polymerase sigma-70 factor (ECF subfamily)